MKSMPGTLLTAVSMMLVTLESMMSGLAGVEILIIDALRYTPHPNHLNIEGALRVVERLRPRRALFTHLTHEVPYADGKNLPVGVEFAYDGLKLETA